MKREEIVMNELKEILNKLFLLDPNQRQWILEVQIPQYICFDCWEPVTDCPCDVMD